MSDQERGAYTPPTDAPLSFDARQPVRGASPPPYALIISILVLIAIAGAVFVFYRSGVRQAGQPPQTVGAPVGEIKSAPPAEAQPQDPAAGLQIYRTEPGQAPQAAPTFAAPPEQPQPRSEPPPVVLAPAPAPAPTKPVGTAAQLPPAPPAASAPKVAPPSPKPLPVAPVAKTPAAAPTPPKPAPPKPVATAPAPAPKAAAGGSAVVQIGAFSSAALADKGWNDAARIAPGAAAGKGKSVEKIDKDGAALYRTAVTGFASKADAAAFCDKLKAAGKSCFVR